MMSTRHHTVRRRSSACSLVLMLLLPACGARTAGALHSQSPVLPLPSEAEPLQQATRADAVDATEQLLRYHHEGRVAHVLKRAELLAQRHAEPAVSVAGGMVSMQWQEQTRDRFAAYLADTEFLEWEDIRPPRVSVSEGDGRAAIVVEKRVRAIRRGESTRHVAADFAWVEVWRRGTEWRMEIIASTDRPLAEDSTPITSRLRAHEVLTRARRAMGGDSVVAMVSMLSYSAAARGPADEFTVQVRSARDGRAYMRQEQAAGSSFEMGVALAGGWSRSATGMSADSLTAVERSVLSGHEVHLLALTPESRFRDPRAREAQQFRGALSDVVEFSDELGGAALFFYHPQTGLPRGFRLTNHVSGDGRTIDVWLDGWRRTDGVMLPGAVECHAAGAVFHYDVTEAAIGWIDDSGFRPAFGRSPVLRRSGQPRAGEASHRLGLTNSGFSPWRRQQ
jgi:hypothetical protein